MKASTRELSSSLPIDNSFFNFTHDGILSINFFPGRAGDKGGFLARDDDGDSDDSEGVGLLVRGGDNDGNGHEDVDIFVSPLEMTWFCNELAGFFGCFSALTLSHISSMVSLSSPDVLSDDKVIYTKLVFLMVVLNQT